MSEGEKKNKKTADAGIPCNKLSLILTSLIGVHLQFIWGKNNFFGWKITRAG